MVNRVHVWLAGQHVADIRDAGGRLTLTYAEQRRPLSLSMSTAADTHGDATVRPWLAGLLPDDDRVLARWARRFHASPTPFALLATPVGLDCAGAVQFTPDGQPLPRDRDSGVTWLGEDEQADLARDLHEDRTGWAERTTGGRFSLAGAQTKVALRVDGTRIGVPYGDAPSNVIIKPALSGFEGHEVNEHLCLAAAARCGVAAAPSRLWEVDGRRLVMVSRFDRHTEGGRLRRTHQEDLCQALSVPPTRRYQAEGGPGPRDVAGLLRRHQTPANARRDLGRFAEALLLNWLLAGTDAHAKNHSLLLSGAGRPRLAPLYDLASIAPYEDVLGAKLSMKLGGEYRFRAIRLDSNVPRMAEELGVDAEWALQRARDLGAGLPDALRDSAVEGGVEREPSAVRLVDGVAAHVRRCLA